MARRATARRAIRGEGAYASGSPVVEEALLYSPALRIAGGTDEILRNIIAERVLGLPPDLRADKDLAFKDIPTGAR